MSSTRLYPWHKDVTRLGTSGRTTTEVGWSFDSLLAADMAQLELRTKILSFRFFLGLSTALQRAMPVCREFFAGQLLLYFKSLLTLFGKRAHGLGWCLSGLVERDRLGGLLWGPHIQLGAFRDISNQLATTTKPVEPRRVARSSAFRSAS